MRADTIVAYVYRADFYCPACVIEEMVARGEASPAARAMTTEDALDQIAESNAIDRHNEWSYDSDDFPKVVFEDMAEEYDRCGRCGEAIL